MAKLRAAAAQGGKKLMTILVHEETHRIRGGQPTRIHGSALTAEVEKTLTSRRVPRTDWLLLASGKTVAVRAGGAAFERQTENVAARFGFASTAEAIANESKKYVKAVYRAARVHAYAQVKAALNVSILDGPKSDRNAKVGELETKANTQWNELLADLIE